MATLSHGSARLTIDRATIFRYSISIDREYMNMVKAVITLKEGAKVTIEGSPDEVAVLVAQFEARGRGTRSDADTGGKKDRKRTARSARASLPNLISDLIDGGFFKRPTEMSAVKVALEEQGHFYPASTIAPALLRMVRNKTLRRVKDKKRWMYVE